MEDYLKPMVLDSKASALCSLPWKALLWHWERWGAGRAGERETLKSWLMAYEFPCVLAFPSQMTFAEIASEGRTDYGRFLLLSLSSILHHRSSPASQAVWWKSTCGFQTCSYPWKPVLMLLSCHSGRWTRPQGETGLSSPDTGSIPSFPSSLASPGILHTWLSARNGGPLKRSLCGRVTVLKISAQQSLKLCFERVLWSIEIWSLELAFPLFLCLFQCLVCSGTTWIWNGYWHVQEPGSLEVCAMDPAPASESLFFSLGLLPMEGSPDLFQELRLCGQTARVAFCVLRFTGIWFQTSYLRSLLLSSSEKTNNKSSCFRGLLWAFSEIRHDA